MTDERHILVDLLPMELRALARWHTSVERDTEVAGYLTYRQHVARAEELLEIAEDGGA